MDFLKELVELQHLLTLEQVSHKLLNDDLDDFEKEQFIKCQDSISYFWGNIFVKKIAIEL